MKWDFRNMMLGICLICWPLPLLGGVILAETLGGLRPDNSTLSGVADGMAGLFPLAFLAFILLVSAGALVDVLCFGARSLAGHFRTR